MVTTTATTWNPAIHEAYVTLEKAYATLNEAYAALHEAHVTLERAYDTLKGMTMISADGETLGTITTIVHSTPAMPELRGSYYFVVKPGMLRQQSWFGQGNKVYVPEVAIADVAEDGVRLTYAADQLSAQGWDQPPAELAGFHRT